MTKSQYIFGNIGNTGTEAGDHIHIPDSIPAFAPAIPFFKQNQEKKGRHGNQ